MSVYDRVGGGGSALVFDFSSKPAFKMHRHVADGAGHPVNPFRDSRQPRRCLAGRAAPLKCAKRRNRFTHFARCPPPFVTDRPRSEKIKGKSQNQRAAPLKSKAYIIGGW
jgi:hypothetical protein